MAFDKELLKGTLPMIVLRMIADSDTYGYELIKGVEQRSSGALSFAEGSLYPVLHTLERDQQVQSYWDSPEGSRRRKYYRITPTGRQALAEREAEWQLFTGAVSHVMTGGRS